MEERQVDENVLEKMNKQEKEEKLKKELESFEHIDTWRGGYFEGDPLDPQGASSYDRWHVGAISVLYATYLRCIKPYINEHSVALEIGAGRGAWTKTLLPAKEVYALDALPEETNQFYKYLGYPKNVKYFQVKDFSCAILPENYFDYMFSFGTMCHISFTGITEYAINLRSKLKTNANCFWMIADYERFNSTCHASMKDVNEDPIPSRWYDAGLDRTCAMLKEVGYRINDADVGTVIRDPIIWFTVR